MCHVSELYSMVFPSLHCSVRAIQLKGVIFPCDLSIPDLRDSNFYGERERERETGKWENKKIIISKFLAIILSSPRISIFSSSQPSADFSMLLVICDSRSFFYLAIESLHFCGFDYWFLIHRLRFVSIGLFDAEISILSFLRIQSMIFELFDI